MRGLVDDVRHAARALGRAPGFSLVAIATLAAGVGLTVAMFSVVYGVLLRPLPFASPDRVVQVFRTGPDGRGGNVSPGPFLDLQREARSLRGVAASSNTAFVLGLGADAPRVDAAEVTANYFDVLGARAALGRVFSARTDHPGDALVLLGDTTWRDAFGGAADVIGRTIRLDGIAHTVVGVMAPGFAQPRGIEVWRLAVGDVPTPPMRVDGADGTQRDIAYLDVIARLTDGVSPAEADAELSTVARGLAARYPATDTGHAFHVEPVLETLVGPARRSLLTLFAAVAAVLLLASTNLAGLVLARTIGRRRELAVRGALGASRLRVARQLVIENVLLALAGGACSLVLGSWLLDGLRLLLPASLPRRDDIHLDLAAAGFAVVLSMLVGVVVGTSPAWWTSALSPADALHTGGRGATAPGRARRWLVAAQVAVAAVLVTGGGLMVRSLVRLQQVDVGFTAEGVVTQPVVLPSSRFDEGAQVAFFEGVLRRLHADPRVSHASVVFPTPLVNNQASVTLRLDRPRAGDSADREYVVRLASIGADYFGVLRTPFLQGRDYVDTDFAPRARALIVNHALAERLLGGGDVLDRRLRLGETADDDYRIVGVVADASAVALEEAPEPTIYLPFSQLTLPFMRLLARGPGSEAGVRAALRAAVQGETADLVLDPTETLSAIMARASAEPRFRARLAAGFAVLALALAAFGVYALLSYSVAGRTRDFATRLALGADPAAVRRDVLVEGLSLAAVGLTAGTLIVIALSRLVDTLLYRTSPTDPIVLAAMATTLLATSALACYLPARRAMRIDPMQALRAD